MKRKLLLLTAALLCTVGMWAGILDGWTKMETNVITNPQNYYFIILHTDNSLMLGVTNQCSTNEAGNNLDTGSSSGPYDYISYQTSAEPSMDLKKVWAIEACTKAGFTSAYILRSLANIDNPAWSERNDTYGPYQLRTNGTYHENNTQYAAMNLTYTNNYWQIQDANSTSYYWGAWSNGAYKNTERVAGNAGGNGNAKGDFNIYYMSRTTFNQKYQFFGGTDMNHAIVNRDFEYGSLTGWTNVRNTTYQCLSNSDAKKNHIGTDTSFGTHYAYLYLAWDGNGDGKLEQTVSNLPDGKYSSTIYLCNDANYVFNGTSADSWGLEKTPADTWTPITVGNQNITDGSTTLSIRDYWDSAADNASLTYVPNNVSDDASAYTLGSTTVPLTWYPITIPENGDYILMSTAASSILYTTSSSAKPAGTEKATLDAGGTLALDGLTAGTLYVGTTADTKLALINVKGDDLTYLIANPSFEAEEDNWKCTNVTSGPNRENSSPTPSDGSWRAGFWNSNLTGDIDIYQSVTLPAGYYRLEFDAYNNGSNTNKWREVQPYFGTTKSDKIPYEEPRSQWRTISFEFDLDATTTANLGVTFTPTSTGQIWENVDNFRLTYLGNTRVAAEKTSLLEEITTANGIYNSGANVGAGAFQIPAAAGTAFDTAINTTAQGVYDNPSATVDDVVTAIENLKTAEETYASTTLNGPASGVQYRIKSTAADAAGWKNLYYVLKKGGNDEQGGYSIRAEGSDAAYLATAWQFTSVSGNDYKLSMIDADGTTRYICTAYGGYGSGNTMQIRTTTDVSKALVVKVIAATGTEGRWYLQNTEDDSYIGGQDAGFYSNSQNYDLAIEAAPQASVELSIAAGKYATRIFPFVPALPSGVKAYSCNGAGGNVLTLVEVLTPAANVPYILENNSGSDISTTLSGYGTASADSYTEGKLTGVYTAAEVPVNSYVLQTQEGVQAFYKVTDSGKKSSAYRAYLTLPSGVKAFFLNFAGETGITETAEKTEGTDSLFDLSGRRVSKAQKGLYIVNGKKVMVK